MRLLRIVGAAGSTGITTSEAARAGDVARPTAHRLLSSLAAEGFLDRDSGTGRWSLGPELYLLGGSAANRYDIVEQSRDIIEHLARDTGESVFLSARRGDETVCVHSQEGSFPLRSHVLHEGIRFPLGVASAGLVILSHLTDREIDEYLGRVDLEAAWGAQHGEQALRSRIADTRVTGYAVNPALLVEGSWGMGAAIFDQQGRPTWALSVTGVETRFRAARRREIGALLLECAHKISVRLRG